MSLILHRTVACLQIATLPGLSVRDTENACSSAEPPLAVHEPPDQAENKETHGASAQSDVAQPLAPPPRPAPNQQNPPESDYFSGPHSNSHFSLEPNPFEQSFGNPSTETPGNKSILPPVASLTSPAPLLGGGASAGGYGWSNSLRSGPLSPAMLGGPVNATDYFDPAIRGSFPTPNESSLRTGLTPGGGGSMFPAPSPNSQAMFQQLANGGATPGTLDFHRTAMSAAAARKDNHKPPPGATSQPPEKRAPVAPMDPSAASQPQQPAFGQHDNDAANGLYMLAQASNGPPPSNTFAVPKPPGGAAAAAAAAASTHPGRSHETSPTTIQRVGTGGSIGESLSGSGGGVSEISGEVSDSGDQTRPAAARTRSKRASVAKPTAPNNARRKTAETPTKPPPAKRPKTTTNLSVGDISVDMDGIDSDEEHNIKEEQYHENGKKMTDEEKRKNFLERNRSVPVMSPGEGSMTDRRCRVAALKCRQRKKQWLANLQAKVELFSNENDTLSAQVGQLREEIVGLKSILLQHKDCPISQSQGLGPYFQQQPEYGSHANPYNVIGRNGQPVLAGQRR